MKFHNKNNQLWAGSQQFFSTKSFGAIVGAGAIAFASVPVLAQNAPAGSDGPAGINIELNSAVDTDIACRISLMATNHGASNVTAFTLEAVLFRQSGEVDRLTLFDLGDLPIERPRVRQFDLGGVACADLSQILINGVATCEGDDLTPETCGRTLTVGSRIEVGLIG